MNVSDAMSPWPEQEGLDDCKYFEQFSYKYLVQICVAQMRRARLEITFKEGALKHRDEWREFGERAAHHLLDTFNMHISGYPADKLEWEGE